MFVYLPEGRAFWWGFCIGFFRNGLLMQEDSERLENSGPHL